ncbi:MAG: hypothetical protein MUF10_11220 [Thermoanaerobaculaceae bacterium]|nr:hypothetical protein [Thermoanaerobaculaceae bacterium]
MPEFVVPFRPKRHQWDALEATKRNLVTWLCAGWGAGKTYALVQWCYDLASHGTWGDGLLTEPDFDTFYDVFMGTWEEVVPGEGRVWKLESTNKGNSKQLVVRNAGRNHWTKIYIRSAMNRQTVKRIEGLPTIGWWAMDEPANMICGHIAFEKSMSRARRPNVHGHNPGLIVGKPAGFNWLAEKFGIETDHPPQAYTLGYNTKPGYFVRAARTRDNAENLRDGYDADLRAFGDLFAAQELDAGIVRAEGLIFPNWYPSFHVIPHAVALRLWEQVRRKAGGVDWGFTNPGCNLPMGLTGDGELVVIDEWYERRRQGEEQGAAAAHFRDVYGVLEWHADPAEPGKLDRWRKGFDWNGRHCRLAVHEAVKHWEAGNDLIRSLLSMRHGVPHPHVVDAAGRPVMGAPRLYVSDRCVHLRQELGAYTQRKVLPGQPPREGAEGDDHAIDALRYGVNHLFRGSRMSGLKVDI